MKSILKNKQIVIGGTLILLIVMLVLLAPLITSGDYSSVDLPNKHLAPGPSHPFDTDYYGNKREGRIIPGPFAQL